MDNEDMLIQMFNERMTRLEYKIDVVNDGIADLKESRARGRGVLAAATVSIPLLSGVAAFFGRMAGH